MPGPRQKLPVSVSKMLTFTIHSSFVIACRVLLELAPLQAGFCPQEKKPVKLPLYISSKMFSQVEVFPSSSFGR